jgi:hypothetical protein
MKCRLPLILGFIAAILPLPVMAAENVHLSIDASKTGVKIDRNIFGQFAENLGHGLYEGIWVGPDSPIPNTRGIRNDVVSALRELKVPNVRWPGGCFADQYHWRKGIGPRDKRPATVNSAWGDVIDTNAFGTDEFMDFIQQIGSTPSSIAGSARKTRRGSSNTSSRSRQATGARTTHPRNRSGVALARAPRSSPNSRTRFTSAATATSLSTSSSLPRLPGKTKTLFWSRSRNFRGSKAQASRSSPQGQRRAQSTCVFQAGPPRTRR